MSRTLVIGLDAATWRVMSPLIKQNKLPNIQYLIQQGVSGKLRSTVPPMTPPAWTSIITGVNPGKHGIYDFTKQDRDTYQIIPVEYWKMPQPAIWDIFNMQNKKVGVFNFPQAFPPPEIKSFFISGIFSPKKKDIAYPSELNKFLKSQGYRIYPRFEARNGVKRYFNEVKKLTEIQCRTALELMLTKEWDLFWIVFQGIDWIQHYLWSSSISGESAVAAFYGYMDKVVGSFLDHAEKDWNILILSDHGFQKINAEIHLNRILEKWGYLKRKEFPEKKAGIIKKKAVKTGWEIAQKCPFFIKQMIRRNITDGLRSEIKKVRREHLNLSKVVDWENTKAFSFGYMGRIYIHEKGKYSKGIVKKGVEYENLCEEIIEKLKTLQDPYTKAPIVGDIFHKKDLYSGEQLDYAPDIVFNSSNFEYMCYGDFGETWINPPAGRQADHDMNGIFVIKGNGIRENIKINAQVIDITPTLLYLQGLPVLKEMDGRVLKEVFNEKFKKGNKLQSVDSFSLRKRKKYQMTKKEQQNIEKRLKDLGYL